MASSVKVNIVIIRVNTVNLGFASGNSIYLMLTICTVTLEAMQYLYNILFITDIVHDKQWLTCTTVTTSERHQCL